jgi:hypothetical protein
MAIGVYFAHNRENYKTPRLHFACPSTGGRRAKRAIVNCARNRVAACGNSPAPFLDFQN